MVSVTALNVSSTSNSSNYISADTVNVEVKSVWKTCFFLDELVVIWILVVRLKFISICFSVFPLSDGFNRVLYLSDIKIDVATVWCWWNFCSTNCLPDFLPWNYHCLNKFKMYYKKLLIYKYTTVFSSVIYYYQKKKKTVAFTK